jgi:hypothetical protein
MDAAKYRVALAMPARGMPGQDMEAYCRGVAGKASTNSDLMVYPGGQWCSLLTYTFNLLWAGFLSKRAELGLTHFAMIHDDVVPEPGWLDTLIREMEASGADLVSAVVPIKDGRGLTSTALETNDVWNPRRLTMLEMYAKDDVLFASDSHPLTVTSDELPGLLVNTGLWVCDLSNPFFEKLYFRQEDTVTKNESGGFNVFTSPEDWNFSRDVKAAGGCIAATLAVNLYHERPEFTNAKPWGNWAVDQDWSRDQSVKARAMKG